MQADVTIVSSLYGDRYDRYVPQWADSIERLNTRPAEIIVGCDRHISRRRFHIPHAWVLSGECDWNHPQAFYLDKAIRAAKTQWVWILDIDDTALPDALDGIEYIHADAWIMGYERSDGVRHIPPVLTAAQFLTQPGNPFTGTSAIKTASYVQAGGFPDVAFQDYGLWRRMALAGMTFRSSDRAHFEYWVHPENRTTTELVPEKRHLHLAEIGL